MPIRDRIVAIVTLLLLNLSVAGAAGAVVKLTPVRDLTPRAASVAARERLAPPAAPLIPAAGTAAPLPGGTFTARLNALVKPYINAVVIDADSRQVLYDQRGDQAAVPASTTKVVTAAAALEALGPDHRLTTKVVQTAGGIALVGGGDSMLAGPSMTPAKLAAAYPRPASLAELAQQTADALKKNGTTQIRVDYDASLYSGPRLAPGWKPEYLPQGQAAPVSSLMIDEGLVTPGGDAEGQPRVSDPAATALRAFVQLLQRDGISARAGASVTTAPSAVQIAAVQSPPVSAIVESLLTVSDNDLAESMARQVAIKRGLRADFAGAAQAVHDTLAGLGLDAGVQTFDGSGLSHSNHITPLALARIVSTAASAAHPELRAVITGMPVAGFSGTLSGRYAGPGTLAGAGTVRAKTGTLDNVNTLAGLAYDAQGRVLAFAFMANNVKDPAAAMGSLDQMAATLASCGC